MQLLDSRGRKHVGSNYPLALCYKNMKLMSQSSKDTLRQIASYSYRITIFEIVPSSKF